MNLDRTLSTLDHATDEELIALLDAEPFERRAPVERHLLDCAECGGRFNVMRRASRRLTSALETMEVPQLDAARIRSRLTIVNAPVRARPSMAAALSVAAAIVLMAGVAAASSPVREWFARRSRPQPVVESTPRTAQQPDTATNPAPGSVVWFTAAGAELVIRFDSHPVAGTLELSASREEQASAQVTAHQGGDSLFILPGELRVRNTAASTADYRVTVPANVRTVRLLIGEAAARTLTVTATSRVEVRLNK